MDDSDIPSFADLAADPEIAALLDFTPVPRQIKRRDGWTGDLQRLFIGLLARLGTPQQAAAAMGKKLSGIEAVYRDDETGEFRAAWDAAVELSADRELARMSARTGAGIAMPPHRRQSHHSAGGRGKGEPVLLPGQRWNEYGEPEDETSYLQRADDAKGRIGDRLVRIRRLFLQEISASPGKRAAYEILTELPIDWAIAERGEPQPDEPWRSPNQREPDMVVLAESGWSFGELGYGPDRKAQARAAIDQYRAEDGLDPIDWSAEDSDAGA